MMWKEDQEHPTGFLHGADYNPDQWLEHPEVIEEDVRLMKEANVNCVALGIFSWAKLEPQEGHYELDWMGKIIDKLYENGIYTILATPTGAMPHWMAEKYEEVRQVRSDGVRNLLGGRHNFCMTSPVMRAKTREIDRRLSQRFGHHPGVILWHLSNEYGNNGAGGYCYCPKCQEAFRAWLKDKYKTLDSLNHAWWTDFWSHTYTDWSQIHSPVPNGENNVHGLTLDWKRFMTYQLRDFCMEEIKAVREYSDVPVTMNMMGLYEPFDYYKFAPYLDVISWDSYPGWHEREDETGDAVRSAMTHSLMRSLKKAPFLMMESTPSIVSWREKNIQKRPGFHELSSLHAIAHGSDSVQYFQWRKSRGGIEKFHGAVVDHRNGDNTRVFREVSALGERLQKLSSKLCHTEKKSKVAVLFDWENRWALDCIDGPRWKMDYIGTVMEHFRVFWEMGMNVDFVDEDGSMDEYSLVIAPLSYMYKEGYAEKVRKYVENGGVYVSTYFSGVADENDLCFLEKHPLEDVLGIRVEEIDAAADYMVNYITYKGKSWKVKTLREVSYTEETDGVPVETLAVYEDDYYKGFPALTCKDYGKGKAYYLACETESDFLHAFYENVLKELEIRSEFSGRIPHGVEVSKRESENETYWFLMNYNRMESKIELPFAVMTVPEGKKMEGEICLRPYECLILEETAEGKK